MRVLIATAGSRGDVAPYTGLGFGLSAAGHEVTIAADTAFADLVTGAGLGFRPLPGDVRALLTSAAGRRMQRRGPGVRGLADFVRLGDRFVADLGDGIVEAVSAGTDVLLLSTTTAPLGYSVAEAFGVASLGVFLQPVEATRAFPPVALGARSLGPYGNLLAGRVGQLVGHRVYARASERLRARLGLAPAGVPDLHRRAAAGGWPVAHGFSPTVVPRPRDWRPGLDVVGYWWPRRPPWRPPPELAAFLDAGPPPVFVGFGSMTGAPGGLDALVVAALRAAGVRGVLQSGWGGLGTGVDADARDMITVGEVPHDWLFERVAAVVHHAGCGTTAAGLRAGVPAVPVPVLGDQPFWASRLVSLGVSPGVVPSHRLDVDRLATMISRAVRDRGPRERARRVAARIATEDGVREVLRAIDRAAS